MQFAESTIDIDPYQPFAAADISLSAFGGGSLSVQEGLDSLGAIVRNAPELIAAVTAARDVDGITPITLDPRGTYEFSSPLRLDQSKHRLIGQGAMLDFRGLRGEVAISIDGSQSPPYRQLGTTISDVIIVGPGAAGSCNGIEMRSERRNRGPCHLSLRNVLVRNFTVGERLASGSYLISHFDCEIADTATAIEVAGGQEMGENLRWFGGAIYNNRLAFRSTDAEGSNSHTFSFFATSFDYNLRLFEIAGGNVSLVECHQEARDYADTPIIVNGNGSLLRITGGRWLLTGGAERAIEYWADIGDGAAISFNQVDIHNSATRSGAFAKGAGRAYCCGGGNGYRIQNNNPLWHENQGLMIDGQFVRSKILDPFTLLFADVDDDRLCNDATALVIATGAGSHGSFCLRYTKLKPSGAPSGFRLALPISPQDAIGVKCKMRADRSGSMTIRIGFGRSGVTDPGILSEPVTASVDVVADRAAWSETSVGGASVIRAPSWADRLLIEFDGTALQPGNYDFDEINASVIG